MLKEADYALLQHSKPRTTLAFRNRGNVSNPGSKTTAEPEEGIGGKVQWYCVKGVQTLAALSEKCPLRTLEVGHRHFSF
jgi:hypothetical protein